MQMDEVLKPEIGTRKYPTDVNYDFLIITHDVSTSYYLAKLVSISVVEQPFKKLRQWVSIRSDIILSTSE